MAPMPIAGAILTTLIIWLIMGVIIVPTVKAASASGASSSVNIAAVSEDPEFTDIIENITVPAGRNVKLACSVKNLGTYKVAWMHYEQSAILTVHNHVITRNPRISVTHDKHDKHRTWFLHINNVQEEDKGRYMCQINTVTAKTMFGYLHVVVPPNIDDSLTSSDVIVRENTDVTLKCRATGSPPPSIKWKRDGNEKIPIEKDLFVSEWEGDTLEMSKISRLGMGAYLCIASNGVPPSVSKRIKVSVDFAPSIWVSNQLVGVPMYQNITLQCTIEAYPTALHYWSRENSNDMIHESEKYKYDTISNTPSYKITMRLTIIAVEKEDYGQYKCVAKNPRGETDGNIRLYSSSPPTTIAPSTTPPPITTTVLRLPGIYNTLSSFNNSGYGQSSTHKHNLHDKEHQSKLNEIGKSEQKSLGDGSSKGWKNEKKPQHSGGSQCFLSLMALCWMVSLIYCA